MPPSSSDDPVVARLIDALASALSSGEQETPDTQIGRYRLLQKIGAGGFGTVWLAEQLEPVRRRVALKIIKAGTDTEEVIARFEAERQALALMDHSNIARVFDAGAPASGRPPAPAPNLKAGIANADRPSPCLDDGDGLTALRRDFAGS